MKHTALILGSILFMSSINHNGFAENFSDSIPNVNNFIKPSQWKGKKVIFLGDSITDKKRIGTSKCYWEYLAENLEFSPIVYAINGNQWNGVMIQAGMMKDELNNDFDAIIIFAGTNDFNAGIPLGEWYNITDKETEIVSKEGVVKGFRKHRDFNYNSDTFTGRINNVMKFLKSNYPTKQIVLLTPIHRGYAKFGNNNIQPQETFANKIGLFLDEYVELIKQAGNVWSVPVIDLNSLSGIYPIEESHSIYISNKDTDRLHPNAEGHYRMAKTLEYQLINLPSSFEE